eukprot:3752204-Pyramimonas_sp.AAC.1
MGDRLCQLSLELRFVNHFIRWYPDVHARRAHPITIGQEREEHLALKHLRTSCQERLDGTMFVDGRLDGGASAAESNPTSPISTENILQT